jgi:hypothetical protein
VNRYQIALQELGRSAGANGEVVEWVNALFEAVGKIRAGPGAMEVKGRATDSQEAEPAQIVSVTSRQLTAGMPDAD